MKIYVHTKSCTQIFTECYSYQPKGEDNTKVHQLKNIKEILCLKTMEYYFYYKRNDVLIHAAAWMNVDGIALNERSQLQKVTYCMRLFMWEVQNREIYKYRKQISGCFGLGLEGIRGWGWQLKDTRFLFEALTCSKIDCSDSCTYLWIPY